MWLCVWTLSKWCFFFFEVVNSCFEMHKFSHLSFLRIDSKTNTLNFWWPWNLGESVPYIVGLFGASLKPTSGTLYQQSVEVFHWMYTLHTTLDTEREHTSDPFLGLSLIPSTCLITGWLSLFCSLSSQPMGGQTFFYGTAKIGSHFILNFFESCCLWYRMCIPGSFRTVASVTQKDFIVSYAFSSELQRVSLNSKAEGWWPGSAASSQQKGIL